MSETKRNEVAADRQEDGQNSLPQKRRRMHRHCSTLINTHTHTYTVEEKDWNKILSGVFWQRKDVVHPIAQRKETHLKLKLEKDGIVVLRFLILQA